MTLFDRMNQALERLNDRLDDRIEERTGKRPPPWTYPFPSSGAENPPRPKRRERTDPRALTTDDYDEFMEATRPPMPTIKRSAPKLKTPVAAQSAFFEMMGRRYPLRLMRLRKDLRWLEKHAAKVGMDPDETRWWL